MPFAKGMVSLSSCTGMIFTFLLVAAVGAFTFTTFSFVAFAGKSSTTDAIKEQAFEEDEIFGDEQGLGIAVGLSGVTVDNFKSNGQLRPDLGELRVSVHERYADGNYTTHPIKTHACTAEELGLKDLIEDDKKEVTTLREAVQAFDKADQFETTEPLLQQQSWNKKEGFS